MKLAEALILRADQKRRLSQLKERLSSVARIQEGENPAENTEELRAQYEQLLIMFTSLVMQINRTNSQTPFDDRRSIADAIADRDKEKQRGDTYREWIMAARPDGMFRYSRTEI